MTPEPTRSGVIGSRWRTDLFLALLFLLLGNLGRYGVLLYLQGAGSPLDYLTALCVWDCEWYRTIIEHGYDAAPVEHLRPGGANWAFFPLYPLLVTAVSRAGVPVLLAGFVVSSACIVAACLAARPLLRGDRAWRLWGFSLLAGPFSMLFATLYTESLFILLIVLSLRALQRENYLQAGIWGALLSATRVTGVLMTLGILVGAVASQRRAGVAWRAIPLALLRRGDVVLSIFLAPVGLFAYMAYMAARSGDGLAFLHIQRAWGRDLGNPLTVLWQALAQPLPFSPDGMLVFTWAVAAIFGLLLALVMLFTRREAAATFTALAILASLSSGVTAMIRFSAGLAPIGMVIAEALARWRWLYWLAFPLSFLVGLLVTLGWYRSSLFVM
ncbi:MAG: hypothetical protein ACTHLT_19575 [Devosia sp.]